MPDEDALEEASERKEIKCIVCSRGRKMAKESTGLPCVNSLKHVKAFGIELSSSFV